MKSAGNRLPTLFGESMILFMPSICFYHWYLDHFLLVQILLRNRPEINNICNSGDLSLWCEDRTNLGLSRGNGALGNVTRVFAKQFNCYSKPGQTWGIENHCNKWICSIGYIYQCSTYLLFATLAKPQGISKKWDTPIAEQAHLCKLSTFIISITGHWAQLVKAPPSSAFVVSRNL